MSYTSFGQTIPVTGPNIGFPGTISRQGTRTVKARTVLSTTASNLSFGQPTAVVPDSSGGTWQSLYDFINAAASNVGKVIAQWAGIAVREVRTELVYPSNQVPGAVLQVGYYAPGVMGEVLLEGTATVVLAAGAPQATGQVYTRSVLNGAVSGGTIGDIEAAPPSSDFIDTTMTSTAGEDTITVASATGIEDGQFVTGAGIPYGTSVTNVGGTTITLSNNVTQSQAGGTPVVFANVIPLPNTQFTTGYVDANQAVEITITKRNVA